MVLDSQNPLEKAKEAAAHAAVDAFIRIDVAIDGADEVDSEIRLIKGGGGCLTQEKIILSCANKVAIVADYRKNVKKFGEYFNYIPIEVIPMAQRPICGRIESQFGGKCIIREAKQKAGPVVTDNGNFLIDWHFDKEMEHNWEDVNTGITLMPGVVETGIFIGMADEVFFGMDDGTVIVRENGFS